MMHYKLRSGRAFGILAALMLAIILPDDPSDAVDTITNSTRTVTAGSADFVNLGSNLLEVRQNSQRVVINWSNFDILPQQSVYFIQHNAGDIALNRVTSGAPTTLQGMLLASGRVFIINPQGIIFGQGFHGNISSIVASTADISNATGSGFFGTDGTDGPNTLNFDIPGNDLATITVNNNNLPVITVHNGGHLINVPGHIGQDDNGYFLALAPNVVVDNAYIRASGGTIGFAAGRTFTMTIDPVGDGLLSFAVVDPVAVHNLASAVSINNGSRLDASNDPAGNSLDGPGPLASGPGETGKVIIAAKYLDTIYNQATAVTVDGFTNYDPPNQPTQTNYIKPCPLVGGVASCITLTAVPGPATAASLTVNPGTLTPNTLVTLDRPVLSLRDNEVLGDSKFTYTNQYFTDRAALNLSVLGGSAPTTPTNLAGNLSPTQLSNLTPSAGGFGDLSPSAGGGLGDLAPSAGGIASNKTVNCANSYLDDGWTTPANQRDCKTAAQ